MHMFVNYIKHVEFFHSIFNVVYFFRNVVDSPIILTDDDDDYKNLDNPMNKFRENGNKMKPDSGEGPRLVKHFVPSADKYGVIWIISDNLN